MITTKRELKIFKAFGCCNLENTIKRLGMVCALAVDDDVKKSINKVREGLLELENEESYRIVCFSRDCALHALEPWNYDDPREPGNFKWAA